VPAAHRPATAECTPTFLFRHRLADRLSRLTPPTAHSTAAPPPRNSWHQFELNRPARSQRSNPHRACRAIPAHPCAVSLYGAFQGVSSGRAAHLFSFVGFFVRFESPFLRPDPPRSTSTRAGAVKVGRRANLTACTAVARPHLDSAEHDGTLGAIGMTIRGELACGRDRATTLYPVGPRTRTMMQS
jgi:hypothetical protein